MKAQAEFRVTPITENQVQAVGQWLADNPSWSRRRLAMELCRLWNWYAPVGQRQDRACRDLLLKLERQAQLVLPRRSVGAKRGENRTSITWAPHSTTVITGKLEDLLPLRVEVVAAKHPAWPRFQHLPLYPLAKRLPGGEAA